MAKRVTFYNKQLDVDEIISYHDDAEASLNVYFNEASPMYERRFLGYKTSEVNRERVERVVELDITCSLTMLSKIEALLRIDYLTRCQEKRRDTLFRRFRQLYAEKEHKVSLEDDILEVWKEMSRSYASVVSEIRGALKYRHWIAHGRYWQPKLARQKYDYSSVCTLVEMVLATLPLVR